MPTNAGEVTLKLNLSQLQRHTDTCNAMLASASYFESAFNLENSCIAVITESHLYLLTIHHNTSYQHHEIIHTATAISRVASGV